MDYVSPSEDDKKRLSAARMQQVRAYPENDSLRPGAHGVTTNRTTDHAGFNEWNDKADFKRPPLARKAREGRGQRQV